MSSVRIGLLLLISILGAAFSHVSASATQADSRAQVQTVRWSGQVTAVSGPVTSPTGFALQLRDRRVDLRIVAKTNIMARSAEAQVEGFAQYDFAIVTAVRSNGEWIPVRIFYDVVPWGPIRDFTLTGKIARFDRTGKTFLMKMASGDTHWVKINRQTVFIVGGVPIDIAPILPVGSAIDVRIHRAADERWYAVVITVKSTGSGRSVRLRS